MNSSAVCSLRLGDFQVLYISVAVVNHAMTIVIAKCKVPKASLNFVCSYVCRQLHSHQLIDFSGGHSVLAHPTAEV